ncbi:hypothetical protein [Aureliella helgolandensis]|uniref:Heme-copper oxidase subunit III family profile domain-containing protein n=1 Tax=Aureliella helgolandensis TaxID=2527968 RepID=A0A518GH73_9BACT|nr:hypothetical protein [Aureliella helgolandensis]QDV27939.1 hypothetical protein Q31a_63320 [Aureliella helgolandensis]
MVSPSETNSPDLQFQPGLPLSRGGVVFGLFLLAEIVFLASLVAGCVGVRWASPSGDWPHPSDMHVVVAMGALGGLSLLGSGATLLATLRAASREAVAATRGWLALTLLLGSLYLGTRGAESYNQWAHNLIANAAQRVLYDRPDTRYLSAVKERLTQLNAELSEATVRMGELEMQLSSPAESVVEREGHRESTEASSVRTEFAKLAAEVDMRGQRQAVVSALLSGAVGWTEDVVGKQADAAVQQMAMTTLAFDISGLPAQREVAEHYRTLELQGIRESLQLTQQRQRAADADEKRAVEAMHRARQVQEEMPKEHRDRSQEDYARAAMLATSAGAAKLEARNEERALQTRQEFHEQLVPMQGGLNRHYPWLRLPVCIPGGRRWASTCLLLTTAHAVHVFTALILLVVLVPWRRTPRRWRVLQGVGVYWWMLCIWGEFLISWVYWF